MFFPLHLFSESCLWNRKLWIVHSVLSAELPDVFWWVKDELLFPSLYADGFMPLHRNEMPSRLFLFFHPNLNNMYFFLHCLIESNFLLKTWGILVYAPCSLHAGRREALSLFLFSEPQSLLEGFTFGSSLCFLTQTVMNIAMYCKVFACFILGKLSV